MNPARLISIATQLALSSDDTPERQDDLRRAVSTAYYAMFHALANSNANALIGAPENDDDNAAWNRTHRALEHGAARSRFRHTGHMEPFPDLRPSRQRPAWPLGAPLSPGPERGAEARHTLPATIGPASSCRRKSWAPY